VGEWFNPPVLKTGEPQGSVSSNLTASANNASVVQLVEHMPEEHGVSGSIPFWGTNYNYLAFDMRDN
jgi:hypothetical protein